MTTVRLVSATRRSERDFWARSYLGRSLLAMPPELRPQELAIRYDNRGDGCLGLSTVYNRAVESAKLDTILLFVHDDVYLHDPFVCRRLRDGLQVLDVIGIAGSRGSDLRQPSWGLAFEGEAFTPLGWQSHPELVLSGAVSHSAADGDVSRPPPVQLGIYGGSISEAADLLDGLLLAVRACELKSTGVSFDERFDFHLYDLDFCRQARRAGLELGTWPILVTHASGGDFSSAEWKSAARMYLNKWEATERSDALFGTPRRAAS